MKFHLFFCVALPLVTSIFTACSCLPWDRSDQCLEDEEFQENERERIDRMCTDTTAVNKCIREQQAIIESQAGNTTNAESWCRENTPEIKCREREKEQ